MERLVRPVSVTAVTGGKGGVGKTSVAVNLATALSQRGRRVALLDGDLGLANADVLLGLSPAYTLAHVICGDRTLEEVMIETPQGFQLLPGASGCADLAQLGAEDHLALVRAFSSLPLQLDHLIVDTAPGLAHGVLQFCQAAQHVLIVLCDDPASLTDAYALVKVLSRNHGVRRFLVLANRMQAHKSGAQLFESFARVAARFLDVTLEFAGEIPADEALRRSVREQRTVLEAYPGSPAARALKKLATAADTWPIPQGPRGNIEFFVERLVQAGRSRPVAVP
ncbi:MAG: MinD/ParA family protein [Proteobacteria bacterium]|nr:MinD/ParA family protein [Pseudomonadota bacterium]